MLNDRKMAPVIPAQDPSRLPQASKCSILEVSPLYSVQEHSSHKIPLSAEVCIVHVIKA